MAPGPALHTLYQPRSAQALGDNPKLLIFGPAPAPTGLHHLQPTNLRTLRMTIHAHSRQPERLTPQGGHQRRGTTHQAMAVNQSPLLKHALTAEASVAPNPERVRRSYYQSTRLKAQTSRPTM